MNNDVPETQRLRELRALAARVGLSVRQPQPERRLLKGKSRSQALKLHRVSTQTLHRIETAILHALLFRAQAPQQL